MCLQSTDAVPTRVATANVPQSRCPQAFLPATQILPDCVSELDTYSLSIVRVEEKMASPHRIYKQLKWNCISLQRQ